MNFNSILFLFTILPIIFLLYLCIPKKLKNAYLVIVSLLFYSWGDQKNILFFVTLIIYNYFSNQYIDRKKGKDRKLYFIMNLLINLFILIYYKYYSGILDFIVKDTIHYQILPVPIGLSFYIFSLISYNVDVYTKKIEAEKNLIDFSLYVSFFPKLLMGPITRYDEIKEKIKKRSITKPLFNNGMKRFIIGLAMKVILANTFASILSQIQVISVTSALLSVFTFTLQIYFDFCGYSHMAIGLGNMFGFILPENFKYPYLATSISDFWRRWHMTLGSFFKDYVYIPLGGNRVGKIRLVMNLMVVWVLTGMWHGATLNFMLWGAYFGVLIVLEKLFFRKILEKIPKIFSILYSFLLVSFGWIFFYCTDFASISNHIGCLFGGNGFSDFESLFLFRNNWCYYLIGIIACTPIFKNLYKVLYSKNQLVMNVLNIAVMIIILVITSSYLVSDTFVSFLYSNF